MDNGEYYSKIFFMIVFAFLVIATFWILSPLFNVIIGAVLLSYTFFPVYKRMEKLIKRKSISSILVVVLIILLITLPSFYIGNALTKEGMQLYFLAKQKISTGKIINVECPEEDTSLACKINRKAEGFVSDPKYKFYLESVLGKVTSFVVEKVTDIILMLPQIMLYLFIMFFTIFFLLKDHEVVLAKIKDWIPLKKQHKENIIKQFNDLAYATIYGQFIVALVQGAVATIAYFIFGVQSPLVWGLLTAFFVLIPFTGSPVIWLPISLHLIINNEIINGVGLFLFGMLIISTIDNIIKPKIIGDRTKLNPALVVLGVVGGLLTLGFMGIILGPLIISLLISFIEVYREEERKKEQSAK